MKNHSPCRQFQLGSRIGSIGWTPLAVCIGLCAIVLALMIRRRDEPPAPPAQEAQQQFVAARPRVLPQPPIASPLLYSVTIENSAHGQILRIRARENGDELIVDAASGKLLSVRDANGKTVPVPNAWPVPVSLSPIDS